MSKFYMKSEKWEKGEWVVCVHHRFVNYTKGKMYQLLEDADGSLINILNDKGERGYPSTYGYEVDKLITYFDKLENIREEKLKQLEI